MRTIHFDEIDLDRSDAVNARRICGIGQKTVSGRPTSGASDGDRVGESSRSGRVIKCSAVAWC